MGNNWTQEETIAWVLEGLRNEPTAQPLSYGATMEKSSLEKEDPPWSLVLQAMEQLITEKRISAEPKFTMPSRGIACGFHHVKLVSPDRSNM